MKKKIINQSKKINTRIHNNSFSDKNIAKFKSKFPSSSQRFGIKNEHKQLQRNKSNNSRKKQNRKSPSLKNNISTILSIKLNSKKDNNKKSIKKNSLDSISLQNTEIISKIADLKEKIIQAQNLITDQREITINELKTKEKEEEILSREIELVKSQTNKITKFDARFLESEDLVNLKNAADLECDRRKLLYPTQLKFSDVKFTIELKQNPNPKFSQLKSI